MTAGRILVVEDETKTAAVLRLYLENAGFEVSLARTGAEALKEARRCHFDLVLLDLMLPEVDGRAVCRAIRSESDVPVVIVTARVAEAEKLEGLRIGADDYITKPFSPREVVARVRAVLRRANPVRPRGPSKLGTRNIQLDTETHEARIRGVEVPLTPAEFELLAVFLRAPGRAFTRRELLERAFGPEYEALERTLDAHVMRLRRKIELNTRKPSLILTVFGVGYKLADAAE